MRIVEHSSPFSWAAALVLVGASASGCSVAAGTPAPAAAAVEPAGPAPLQSSLARGKAVYEAGCAECHGPDLGGGMGSILRGDGFLKFWIGKPTKQLAERILYTMPATAPGSLSDEEAADVTLYLLERNGTTLPASTSADALSGHLIERATN